jgi:pyruvate,water dikinase
VTAGAIAPLREATDLRAYGGKAVALGAALRAGLPVPDGFALSVAAVDRVAAGSDHDALVAAFDRLGGPVAVRSSAIGEDSEGASFAGQHLSLLNVTSGAAAIDAVREVRASGHTAAALAYRKRSGVGGEPQVAVVVQRLVHSEAAGVLFTRCPISGRDERVIECAWGLGEAVVSGLVNPDRYRVARGGRVVERTISVKDMMIVPRAQGGTEEVPVDDTRASAGLLDAQLAALDALASHCERVFGDGGHDLEWAFSDPKTLYLLQRRPITRTA